MGIYMFWNIASFDYYWNDLTWIALKGSLTIHPSNDSTVQFYLTLETLLVKEYNTILSVTVGLAGTRIWYSTIQFYLVP